MPSPPVGLFVRAAGLLAEVGAGRGWREIGLPIALAVGLGACAVDSSDPPEEGLSDVPDEVTSGTSGWSWQTFAGWNGLGLWTQSVYQGRPQFDAMFGSAGALEFFRYVPNGNQSLLAPSYQGEHTDRIIQGTLWVHNVEADHTAENGNPSDEYRWNITQAGNHAGTFSRTMRVTNNGNRTDIWAVADKQWFPQHQEDFAGSSPIPTLTRYERLDAGVLKIRRVLRLPRVVKNGIEQTNLSMAYTNWSPFASSPTTFDGLAFGLAPGGTPSWWYHADYNIPHFPRLPVADTRGYGVVYQVGAHASTRVVGLAFSRSEAEVYSPDLSSAAIAWAVLNSMNWSYSATDKGIAVLPGLQIRHAKPGTIVDLELRLVPRSRSSSNFVDLLDRQVAETAPYRLYEPGAPLPPELEPIAAQLEEDLHDPGGQRTNQLAAMAGY